MMKKHIAIMVMITVIAGGSILSGCIQQQQQGNEIQLGSGTLRLYIKDKPGDYTILHVNITLSEVQVHSAGILNETENITSSGGAFNVSINSPYKADIGENISFQGNATDGQEPYNWSWDFGDGNTSTLQNPSHKYTTQGIYLVNLTVTDQNNSTAWAHTNAYIGHEEDDNESGWLTIVNASQTFDLIALQNVSALLGQQNLTAGKYTQIRLTVESANITINRSGEREEHTLKVPSSSIKLIHPFTITENKTTVLTLDFLVDQSIHETGNGKFLLKPTIKIIQE
jgi:PKD repeat protein